jgi:hypothetical protein
MNIQTDDLLAYLAVLEWVGIADAKSIRHAYDLSTGTARSDLELGIRSVMMGDRLGLLEYFPELVQMAPRLDQLAQGDENFAKALRDLRTSAALQKRDPAAAAACYRVVARRLSQLQHLRVIIPPHREALLIELATVVDPKQIGP